MNLRIRNWTINFSGNLSWRDFWWTPNDGLIRRDNATYVSVDENGKQELYREFFTLRALFMTAVFTPFWYLNQHAEEIKRGTTALAEKIGVPPKYAYQLGVIAFDAVSSGQNGSGTSVSFSHTVSGPNPLITIGTGFSNVTATDQVASASYNGIGSSVAASNSVAITALSNLSYNEAPATGAHTVAVSLSPAYGTSQLKVGSISYTGAAQTSSLHVANSGGNTGSAGTLTVNLVNTVTNTMSVLVRAGGAGGSVSANGSLNQEWSFGSSARPAAGADQFNSGTGTVACTCDDSGGSIINKSLSAASFLSAATVSDAIALGHFA